MQISTLSDSQLLTGIKSFIAKERKITSLIIEHIEEIERRKLYCDLKYQSLFKYCVKELGYSEDQACRRINAMRVAKTMPQIKHVIDTGSVPLTTLNLFSAVSNELKLNPKDKQDLMERFKGKSKRACQLEADQFRKEQGKIVGPKPTIIRAEAGGKTRLSVSLEDQDMRNLRSLAAEQNLSLAQLLAKLIQQEKEISTGKTRKTPAVRKGKDMGSGRYITRKVKEMVRARAGYQCENCGSTHNLQFEHRTPVAMGGKSDEKNLKVLCRNCNLRAGISVYGIRKLKR